MWVSLDNETMESLLYTEPEALDEMGRTFPDEPILKIPKSLLVEFLLALQRQRWRGSVR